MRAKLSGGSSESRVVRIFVAYDRPEAGDRAETLCAQLERADEFPFEVQPWRANAVAATDALVHTAACNADIFVVAWAAPEGPPEFLFQFVTTWGSRRSVPNATLAALPVGEALLGPTASSIFHRLRQVAGNHGLTFVCDWTDGLTLQPGDFSHHLHEREQLVTPTLLAILAERHFEPHLEWGLNE
jgi:hypothetical protein